MFRRYSHMLMNRGYWDQAGDDGNPGGGAPAASTSGEGGQPGAGGDGAPGTGDGDKGVSGEPKPSDSEARLLKEVMQKKEKIRALEEQINAASAELKKFEGIDLEQVRTLLSEREALEQKKLEEKGQWDALKKQMSDAHAAQVAAIKAEAEAAKQEASKKDSVIERLTIGHAFDSSAFISAEMTLTPSKARVVYGDHFDVVDGEVVAYDKPRGAAGRAPLVDGKGDNLSFEDAIKKIVDADPDRDVLLKAKVKPGADSKQSPPKVPEAKQDLRGQARIAAALGTSK